MKEKLFTKTKLVITAILLVILCIISIPVYIYYNNAVLARQLKENYTAYLMNSSEATVYLICLEILMITAIVAIILFLKNKNKLDKTILDVIE